MANPQSALALDLTSSPDRSYIDTDVGRIYIRNGTDFSLLQTVRHDRLNKQIEELLVKWNLDTITEEECGQLEALLKSYLPLIVDADESVLEKVDGLGIAKRLAIKERFSRLSTDTMARWRAKPEEPSDGMKPSPDSSASTAEVPSSGSPTSPRALSAVS